jgi:threonine/homoserine/homoserine lactone efflux protein
MNMEGSDIRNAFQLGFIYSLLSGPTFITSSQCVITGGWRQSCWFILGVTLGGARLIKIGFDAMRLPFNDQYTNNVPLLA